VACTSLQVADVPVTRQPGSMQHDPNEIIALIEDPDGYRIELIEILY
jgi:lactoylglutathione lyase